jgi:hypothetical protein
LSQKVMRNGKVRRNHGKFVLSHWKGVIKLSHIIFILFILSETMLLF